MTWQAENMLKRGGESVWRPYSTYKKTPARVRARVTGKHLCVRQRCRFRSLVFLEQFGRVESGWDENLVYGDHDRTVGRRRRETGVDALIAIDECSLEGTAKELGPIFGQKRVELTTLLEIGSLVAHVIQKNILQRLLIARVSQFLEQLGLLFGQIGEGFVAGCQYGHRALLLQSLHRSNQIVLAQQVHQGRPTLVTGESTDSILPLRKSFRKSVEGLGQAIIQPVAPLLTVGLADSMTTAASL